MHLVVHSTIGAVAVWAVLAASLSLLLLTIWAVLTSSKFERKARWIFLACLGIPGLSAQIPPSITISGVVPIGMIVVLWVWRFGPSTSQQRRDDEERRPKSVGKFFSSKAGYSVSMLAALAIVMLSMVSGSLAMLVLGGSAGLVCLANEHRGRTLGRRRAAFVASASWCLSALLLGGFFGARHFGLPNFDILGIGAFVALWPWFFCTGALVQNSWGLPQPEPEARD